ncbi:HpaII family restriction endonuclease [Paenibacillus lignilyticus]|uniref:HpaII family restriction endonuclease n=1 Tax=Paenibacillus lignilyticus TaxID=1172615 RepID=A0ABS5CK99_9BACL|nr:HpaII family restriction endonuclease [Paenibacillus lignilyticus]MBP3966250.1 HpaII family restriction endonuclease [Paenibacillus lignilyticus]
MTIQKYNKGEWSETYALLKLLADGILRAADADLNAIPHLYYPLINILRYEKKAKFKYEYDNNTYDASDNIIILDENWVGISIPIQEFKDKSLKLFDEIKKAKSTTFPVSTEIDNFLKSINVTRKAEQSTHKRDITIVVHDEVTGHSPELGFSIKSKLGSAATLLNAGNTTNFIYKLEGDLSLTDSEIKEINIDHEKTKKLRKKGQVSKESIADREKYGYEPFDSLRNTSDLIRDLECRGFKLKFIKPENEIFNSNLELFDSSFPFLFSEILYYIVSKQCGKKMTEIFMYLEKKNPLNYNLKNKHPMYSYKIKNFLIDTSLGLMPGKVWKGTYDANGGYIIVKADGELVCYHIYNRNEFQDYLVENTYLDQGSRFKHGFGFVYRKDSELYINLNLQIRFIKNSSVR